MADEMQTLLDEVKEFRDWKTKQSLQEQGFIVFEKQEGLWRVRNRPRPSVSSGISSSLDEWCFVHDDGTKAFEETFDTAGPFYEGLASVSLEGAAFHITHGGYRAYTESFDMAGPFSEGVAPVIKNLLGDPQESYHIKRDGTPAYTERYELVDGFSEGLAPAKLRSAEFHITYAGKPAYVRRFQKVSKFRDGAAHAELNGQIMLINHDGELIQVLGNVPSGTRCGDYWRYDPIE